jgi:hypothetical protein
MDFEEFVKQTQSGRTFEYDFMTPKNFDTAKALYHFLWLMFHEKLRKRSLLRMYKHHQYLEHETIVDEFKKQLNDE